MSPLQYGELVFMLWLLIMGATPKPLSDPALLVGGCLGASLRFTNPMFGHLRVGSRPHS